jgi:pheromone shutdown-related protein TraB
MSDQEPQITLEIDHHKVTLLGTAHVSRQSAETVNRLLDSGDYDDVAIELCQSRHQSLQDPDSLAKMDLLKVIRSGKATMVMASLALSAFQQRVAEQFGIEPGAEMRAAMTTAKTHGLNLHLIDREIGITLKRVYFNVPWWQRMTVFSGLVASVLSREKIEEEDIERLKQGDILSSTFEEFSAEAGELYQPLIDERDRYMAYRIYQILQQDQPKHLLVVVGAGHLKGIAAYLEKLKQERPEAEGIAGLIAKLNDIPKKRSFWKWLPWIIVGVIVAGFAYGFSKSPELGLSLVKDWVLINGVLCALGALLAAAHPITIISAFIAAPITSLNPTIGAGMVTGAIELFLRRPQVQDFSNLRHDTAHWQGWWKNRVSRVLLVFFFSTLGSAAGTYIAGFRIFDKLTG